jgi:hypothetical protein
MYKINKCFLFIQDSNTDILDLNQYKYFRSKRSDQIILLYFAKLSFFVQNPNEFINKKIKIEIQYIFVRCIYTYIAY